MAETVYLIDEYVSTTAGEPYRLFPFGALYKGGKKRVIDAAYAARFRLPHFKPPIKLGSHEEATPAGGQIIGLEVRADGLYAIPELTDQGAAALSRGDYRYHSPEVIWETGGLEDPATGEILAGPLIVGDALLHTPHLGEAAALYSIEPVGEEHDMADENVSVPKPIWDKFTAWLDNLTAPRNETPPAPVVEPEQLTALTTERDQYKAELETLRAEQAAANERAAIVAQLQDQEKFGGMYIELGKAEEAAGMLSGMNADQRDWVMRTFSAHAAQINTSALYSERGSTGAGAVSDPSAALDAEIKRVATEKKIGYHEAFAIVGAEKPEMFNAVYGKEK